MSNGGPSPCTGSSGASAILQIVRRQWSVQAVCVAFLCAPALAAQCPASHVGGQPALQQRDLRERAAFIRLQLQVDARHARIWSYTWMAIYSSLTAGQFIAAPLVSHADGLDLYVGGGAAVLGLAPLVITPLKVMGDEMHMGGLEDDVANQTSCPRLFEMEELLEQDAANEAQGHSLLFHGGNVVVNAGIFFIIGSGFGHWTSATISLLTGIATGEIMIFTQPVGAERTLRQYRRGDFAPPNTGSRIAIAPMFGDGRSGLMLTTRF